MFNNINNEKLGNFLFDEIWIYWKHPPIKHEFSWVIFHIPLDQAKWKKKRDRKIQRRHKDTIVISAQKSHAFFSFIFWWNIYNQTLDYKMDNIFHCKTPKNKKQKKEKNHENKVQKYPSLSLSMALCTLYYLSLCLSSLLSSPP